MASIFSLYGSIFIDNEKANQAIDTTTNKGKESEKSFTSSLGSIVSSAAKIGTAIVGATTAVVSGVSAMAMSVADTAGDISDTATRVGMTAEEYQKWAYAAKLSGVESSKLQSLMVKQQKSFADAKEGSSSLSEAYKRLGIDINSISSSEEAFNQVMASLASLEDETTRNALANDIFGKSYADLAPLLAEGADGMAELRQEAVDLGGVMSNESVAAGEAFGDMVDSLKTGFTGAFNSLVGELFPVLQEFIQVLLDNIPMIQSVVSSLAPILINLLSSLLPPLMDLAQTLLPIIIDLINQLLPFITQVIEAILPVIIDLLNMLLPPLMQIISAILPLLLSLIQPLLPLLQPIFQLLQPFIDVLMALLVPLIDLINIILPPIINLLTMIINAILPPLQGALNITASILTNTFGRAFSALTPIIEGLKKYLSGIINFITGIFTGNWKKAWQGVKDIFSGIISTITSIFKAPINFIIDGINTFISGLNKIKIPDWVPGVGGKGLNISLIKKLRVGMDYVPYDEMPALLHKGERVLTADENKEYVSQQSAVTNNEVNNNFSLTINSTEPLSPAETARQTRKALQEYNLKYGKV